MIGCRDIEERAAALVALPDDDPDRRAARAHAGACRACAEELRQAEQLLSLVAAGLGGPPPAAPRLDGVGALIVSRLAAERLSALRRVAAGTVAAFGLLAAPSVVQPHAKAAWVAAGLLAVIALAAGLAAVLQPRRAAGLAALASLVAALVAGGRGPLASALGVHCVIAELVAAAVPFGVLLVGAVRGRAPGGTLRLASVAAAGALAGQAALHVACPEAGALPHLLGFHLGGVLLAPLAAMAVGGAAYRLAARWQR